MTREACHRVRGRIRNLAAEAQKLRSRSFNTAFLLGRFGGALRGKLGSILINSDKTAWSSRIALI